MMTRTKMRWAMRHEQRLVTYRQYAWLVEHIPYRATVVRAFAVNLSRYSDTLTNLARDEERRMKRDTASAVEGPGSGPSSPPGLLAKSYPVLGAFLTDNRWDDGEPRLECWLQIRPKAGKWLIELNDPNYARQCRLETDQYSELFPVLEGVLAGGKVPWVHQDWLVKFGPKTKRKKLA